MLKMYLIVSGLCMMIFGVLGGRTKQKNNRTEIPLLDKFQQHDYKINFERVEALRYNDHYVKQFHVVTFKYNRTCPLVNITAEFKVDSPRAGEMIVQAYKFASNEYRLFPIRFQFNFCQGMVKNIAGIGDFKKFGNLTGCTFVKGKIYNICNWGPNPEMFPPFIPNGQYMLELQALYLSSELWTMRGYGTVSRPISIPRK